MICALAKVQGTKILSFQEKGDGLGRIKVVLKNKGALWLDILLVIEGRLCYFWPLGWS